MYCQYGDYKHEVGEVEYSIRREGVYSDAQTPKEERWTLDATGMLLGDGSRSIDDKVKLLVAAYSLPGRDWRVVIDAGGGLLNSQHSLASKDTDGGILIDTTPSFPSNANGAYANYLVYSFSLSATIPVANPKTALDRFEESLAFEGGGPEFGSLEPNIGRPVIQRLKQSTTFIATQQGQAVGVYSYPTVPAPLWPSSLRKKPSINKTAPQRFGSGSNLIFKHYGVQWKYEFLSPFPFFGNPHAWGA